MPPLPSDAELSQTPNIFAEIIAGRLPASVVYRDEEVIAFMDIQPINQGHVLVMPIQPARFLNELNDRAAAHLFLIAKKVALAIRQSGLPCSGVNMFLADGAAAGQEVPHVHVHVFPRFDGDGFGFTFAERYFNSLPDRAELDEAAARIRGAIGQIA